MAEWDNALNFGTLNAKNLYLAEKITVYSLTDDPLSFKSYLDWLEHTRIAFPDLYVQSCLVYFIDHSIIKNVVK